MGTTVVHAYGLSIHTASITGTAFACRALAGHVAEAVRS